MNYIHKINALFEYFQKTSLDFIIIVIPLRKTGIKLLNAMDLF